MLTITDGGSLSRALSSPIDPRLKRLLRNRIQQLNVEDLSTAARIVIVQPGDTIANLDQALGFSVFMNPGDGTRYGDPDFTPGWEWIEDHSHSIELLFIMTDDGFAHVVLAPRDQGINADLLKFCEAYAGEHVGS